MKTTKVTLTKAPKWNTQTDPGVGPVALIKRLREVVRHLGLKEAKEFVADGVALDFTPVEWKAVQPILREFKCEWVSDGKPSAKATDPLGWLLSIKGGIQVTLGGSRPNGDSPRLMYNVVVYPVDGPVTWVGPRKRSPRLAIERAMERWAAFQARKSR